MSIQVCDVLKVVTISRNKIISVTADDSHIYVSCKDGKLMIYQLTNSKNCYHIFTIADPLQFSEMPSISMFSGVKKGSLMMKCILKWNLLFSLNDKGIAVVFFAFYYNRFIV